jgi:hypothetical protein
LPRLCANPETNESDENNESNRNSVNNQQQNRRFMINAFSKKGFKKTQQFAKLNRSKDFAAPQCIRTSDSSSKSADSRSKSGQLPIAICQLPYPAEC